MKMIVAAAAGLFALAALAQDPKAPDSKTQAPKGQDQKTMPQPGKEHDLLKQLEGEWDVVAKCLEPGKEQTNRGTETGQMELGGFWLTFEHKGTHDGKAFEGRGFMGYDPQKKKYVGVWVVSLCPSLASFEGEADPSGKTLTLTIKGTDPKTGKKSKERMVYQLTDKDHRTVRFYRQDDAGKETMASEMTYTRKGADVK